jgi:ABC-2 type transport system ATP-binding protein
MIIADQISKSYEGARVLEAVTFTARPGRISLLTGDNGAGKSTTLRILAGLAAADSGRAYIDGFELGKERRRAQERLSFLPQGTSFQPAMTPWQLLNFYAGLRSVPRNRIEPLLARVDLLAARNKAVRKLSGGMMQRLGLALLLLPDAPVLILDEPGISLDPGWREWLRALLEEEAARGKTVLITTHLLAEWEGTADETLVCRGGRVYRKDELNGSALAGGRSMGIKPMQPLIQLVCS